METSELTKEQLKLRYNNLYICPCCKEVKSVNDAFFYEKTSFVHTHNTPSFGKITKHYNTSTYLVRICESCFRKQVRKSKIELYVLIFFVASFAILGAVLIYILFRDSSTSVRNHSVSTLILYMLIFAIFFGWVTYYIIGYLYKLIHYFSDKKFKYEKNIGNNAIEDIHRADPSRVYEPKLVSIKEI